MQGFITSFRNTSTTIRRQGLCGLSLRFGSEVLRFYLKSRLRKLHHAILTQGVEKEQQRCCLPANYIELYTHCCLVSSNFLEIDCTCGQKSAIRSARLWRTALSPCGSQDGRSERAGHHRIGGNGHRMPKSGSQRGIHSGDERHASGKYHRWIKPANPAMKQSTTL